MTRPIVRAVSWLFVPASRPDRLQRAMDSGADAIILDLEDATASRDKNEARNHAAAFLEQAASGVSIAVRINTMESEWGAEDIARIGALPSLTAVVLPKTESAAQVSAVASALSAGGSAAGIIALVETARGVAVVEEIADAGAPLEGLMFGAADYAADLGVDASILNADYARARLANAAAAARITAIDAPFFDIADTTGLREASYRALALGFRSKALIHPGQVNIVKETFSPSAADMERANRILAALKDGVASVDGKMVDEAMARWARSVLDRQ